MSNQASVMDGWSDGQVNSFAKQFAFTHRATWPAYVDCAREALIDSYVLLIALGQESDDLDARDLRSLRTRLGKRLLSKHRMRNPIADLEV